jgi:hypothetical protein
MNALHTSQCVISLPPSYISLGSRVQAPRYWLRSSDVRSNVRCHDQHCFLHSHLLCTDASPVFTQIYSVALQYANVSFRTDANAFDVVAACEEAGIDVYALRKVARRKRKPNSSSKFTVIYFAQRFSIIMHYFELLTYLQLPKLHYLCFRQTRRLHSLYSSRLTRPKMRRPARVT